MLFHHHIPRISSGRRSHDDMADNLSERSAPLTLNDKSSAKFVQVELALYKWVYETNSLEV